MAADEIDDDMDLDEELDDEIDGDLDEELDDELDDEIDDGDGTEPDDDDDEGTEIPVADVRSTEEDDEDIPDADDVEASLDVILKEKLVVEDESEEEGAAEVEDRGDGNERVLPKQSDEFVCTSCFLVKSANQLADKKKKLCRDCV